MDPVLLIVILVIILLVFGGGWWGYRGAYGPSVYGIGGLLITLLVIIVLLKILGVF